MADNNELVLLDVNTSPFAGRVRVALAEKGLNNYESKTEDLSNKSSLLLEMNPILQQVPVLIHNGKPICDSLIIIEYIDEVWSHKSPLLPSDPYQRARARFWADFIDNKIVPSARIIVVRGMEKEVEAAKKVLIENCKLLEAELGEEPYFGGDNFGFLDVAFIPLYPLFYSFEKFANVSMEDEVPNLVAWAKRCMEKETVSESIADSHVSYHRYLALRKRFGTQLPM